VVVEREREKERKREIAKMDAIRVADIVNTEIFII